MVRFWYIKSIKFKEIEGYKINTCSKNPNWWEADQWAIYKE